MEDRIQVTHDAKPPKCILQFCKSRVKKMRVAYHQFPGSGSRRNSWFRRIR